MFEGIFKGTEFEKNKKILKEVGIITEEGNFTGKVDFKEKEEKIRFDLKMNPKFVFEDMMPKIALPSLERRNQLILFPARRHNLKGIDDRIISVDYDKEIM